jgi:FtsK/SpoIIIE family/FtsK alpha domain/4TM region of DNA translocase FtsK/SpoIIIE
MATAQEVTKRRLSTSSVRRTQTKSKKETFRAVWVNEVLALLCWSAGVFFLSAALTPRGVASAVFFGEFGSHVGQVLSRMLGWCAVIPSALLIRWGLVLWNVDDSNPLFGTRRRAVSFLVGTTMFLVSSCTLAGLIAGNSVGGWLGDFFAFRLTQWLGLVGATLVAGSIMFWSIAASMHVQLADIGETVWGWIRILLVTAVITVPKLVWTGLQFSVIGLRKGFKASWEWLHEEVEVDLEELPAPRARARDRNAGFLGGLAKKVEKLSTATPETLAVPQPEEPAPEPVAAKPIVVNRREGSEKVSETEIRKVRKRIMESADAVEAFAAYVPPELKLLEKGVSTHTAEDDEELKEKSRMIETKLRDFGIFGRVTHIHPGPVITLFEFEPAPGVKVGKIAALSDDLSMSLRATSIRIIAPIPRRGTVGIEIPNKNRDIVRLRDVLESEAFVSADSILSIPIGKDTYGDPVVVDVAQMPHLLIAGATGTGKSVCINSILVSLLYRSNPAELGLILIDPKVLELSIYDNIPHLRVPVVTVPRQAKAVLEWAVNEMNRRYRFMQKFGVRNVDSYNKLVKGEETPEGGKIPDELTIPEDAAGPLDDLSDLPPATADGVPIGATEDDQSSGDEATITPERLQPLPKIVIVIDELADLMLTVGRDIEELITRLAQKARAAGIHLILATQRPSVDVITGLIKANFPAGGETARKGRYAFYDTRC